MTASELRKTVTHIAFPGANGMFGPDRYAMCGIGRVPVETTTDRAHATCQDCQREHAHRYGAHATCQDCQRGS